MKATPSQYAESLLAAATGKTPAELLVKNLNLLLKRQGKQKLLKKILLAAQKRGRSESGEIEVIIETAHEAQEETKEILLRAAAQHFSQKKIIAHFRTNEQLLAGYRIYSDTHLVEKNARGALKELSRHLRTT